MWGKLKFKVLRKVHISGIFQPILSKILLNFPIKSSQSSALNLWSFEDSLASENEPKMKTKMDLRTKIFEASKIFEALLQHCCGSSGVSRCFMTTQNPFERTNQGPTNWNSINPSKGVWIIWSRDHVTCQRVTLCHTLWIRRQ